MASVDRYLLKTVTFARIAYTQVSFFCVWCSCRHCAMSVCLNLAGASCASRCVWSSQVVALSGCAYSRCVISTLDPIGELLFETVGAEWSGLF